MREEKYETSDFMFSITLLSLGYELNYLDAKESRIKFVFNSSRELLESVDDYWNNRIQLNPKLLFSTQRELKARMSEARK